MPINVSCGACGKPYTVKDELAGKRAKCTACGAMIPIPPAPLPHAAHGYVTDDSSVSQPPQLSRDVPSPVKENAVAPGGQASPAPPPLSGNTMSTSQEPLPPSAPPRALTPSVPPTATEVGLVLLPPRSKGLIAMAVLNCLIGCWGIFSFVALLAMGVSMPWLMRFSDLVLSILLVVSGIGYYRQDEVLGWRVGNAYGCLGVLRYFLLVKLVGWFSCLWFALWLIYPLLTLVLLHKVFRSQFPGPLAGRRPFIPAHWSMRRRAAVLLACGALVYLVTPGGAFLTGQWYSGDEPQSEPERKPVNPYGPMGMTALHTAASQGLLDEMKKLLDKGADVNARSKYEGYTPLHAAAEANAYHAVELLLARKAEVNVKDDFGRTPLHSVAKGGSVDIARLLVEKGAEVNATDVTGNTPMHVASGAGQTPIVLLLLSKGGNVNARSQLGATPLDCAERNPQMQGLLRSNGAKPGRPAL